MPPILSLYKQVQKFDDKNATAALSHREIKFADAAAQITTAEPDTKERSVSPFASVAKD